MIAEFAVFPLDGDHMSEDVAKVIKTLEATGLDYRLGPMGTCVEGTWEQV
ncbi:MAG: thiamine-binding protein, partial [Planctomycetaceae bacterium]|nr:thiamine-binding protein [Planctomycetaceae bacterium]